MGHHGSKVQKVTKPDPIHNYKDPAKKMGWIAPVYSGQGNATNTRTQINDKVMYYYLNRGNDVIWNDANEINKEENCKYTDWSNWSKCDVTCDTRCGVKEETKKGMQKRQRYILSQGINGGKPCNNNDLLQQQDCQETCPNTPNCKF